jgi:tetratricopeptide (TPR) repeat protein
MMVIVIQRWGWRARYSLTLGCALLLSISCQTTQGILEKGRDFHRQKKYAEAELQFRRALQKEPNLAQAHFELAESIRLDGRMREAMPSYLKAYELAPQNVRIRETVANYLLDIFLLSRRKPKLVYDQLNGMANALINADPQSAQGLTIRAALAMSEKDFQSAVEDLRTAVKVKPDDERARMLLVEALHFSGQSKEAAEAAKAVLSRNPDNAGALSRLYSILISTNQIPAAGQLLEEQARGKPSVATALLLAGHASAHEKDPAKAESILDTVASNAKLYPGGALAVARAYMRSGNLAAAGRTLESAIDRKDPDLTELRKLLAEIYWQSRKLDEASEQVKQARLEKPADQSIELASALLLLARGTPEAAAEASGILDRLKNNGFLDPQLEYHRARALIGQRKIDEGVKVLQDLSRRQRGNLNARFALLVHYMDKQQWSDALQVLGEIDAIDPENERATQARLTVLRRLGRLDEARNLLQQAKNVFPDANWLIEEQGLQGLIMQRHQEALASYKSLYDKGLRTHSVIAGLAESYSATKNLDAAQAVVAAQIKANPQSRALQALRGELSFRQGKLDSAIAEYERLAETGESDDYAYRRLASLYEAAKRYPDAVRAYAKLESMKRILQADYYRWLQTAIDMKNAAEVQTVCGKLETDFAKDWSAANNCAFAIAETGGDLLRAERIARDALLKIKDQPNLRDTLGWILAKQGKSSEALTIFETLLRQQPQNPTFRYHRAIVLVQLDRKAEAQAELQRALKDKPGPTLAKAIQQSLTDSR